MIASDGRVACNVAYGDKLKIIQEPKSSKQIKSVNHCVRMTHNDPDGTCLATSSRSSRCLSVVIW